EHGGQPAVEEDAEAAADLAVHLRLEGEGAVVGVDDRERAGGDRADAADQEEVVVEDEVTEAGELAVRGHDRDVRVRVPLVLVDGKADAGGAARLQVEGRDAVQTLVERS